MLRHEVSAPDEGKLIRDAVHGYQVLEPHEVAVLDLPVIQRLRGIHQTAMTYFVYPTATHTRFDHSLGVARMVSGMIEGLRVKTPVSQAVSRRVRLAALLHDCGHLLFSHLGEDAAATLLSGELRAAKALAPALFTAKKLGEVVSYLIATSPTVAEPIDDLLKTQRIDDVRMELVSPLIIGQPTNSAQQFEADIISGPFDADKLDYLLRDCHFSGIRSTIDVERIYYTVRELTTADQPRSLAMHISGVPNLEQVLFAKMMLFPAVYQHQKVRALECTFKGIIERLIRDRARLVVTELRLETLVDWLALSESDFFVLGQREPAVKDRVRDLLERRSLRRALVISPDTVTQESEDPLFHLGVAAETQESLSDLRRAIIESMDSRLRCDPAELWVDVPDLPNVIQDVEQVKVTYDSKTHVPLSSDRFQWDRWTSNYAKVKWKAHLFCPDDAGVRREAARATQAVLRDRYKIELGEAAWRLAKNDSP